MSETCLEEQYLDSITGLPGKVVEAITETIQYFNNTLSKEGEDFCDSTLFKKIKFIKDKTEVYDFDLNNVNNSRRG